MSIYGFHLWKKDSKSWNYAHYSNHGKMQPKSEATLNDDNAQFSCKELQNETPHDADGHQPQDPYGSTY